ncbi:MAG: HyaD/HybD family hydrogenase maturation endopeptidase [Gammaproteobacteria bacterium]|nr:HyaD/HybD family hydrogenase maturation endopeptidase [Gammaproteobacteria bacterium]
MSSATFSIADGNPGAYETLILGIGNILWADEGFGIRAVEELHRKFTFPDNVRVMDGGTQGIFLLPWVRNAKRLLIFDAVDFNLEPATLKLIRGNDVPRFMGAKKMSMHQTGFQEVLSSADLAGELPAELALVGVQPELLNDYGGSLRDSVRHVVPEAIDLALEVLAEWGVYAEPRAGALAGSDLVSPGELDIRGYEQGRPKHGGDTL